MKKTILTATLATLLSAGIAAADSWKLDGSNSTLGFGSVKNTYNGEAHSFNGLSGTVTDGKAEIMIDLSSVQTNVDIRNERMIEHVFKNTPSATISAELDMEKLNALTAGDTSVMEVDATLTLLGQEVNVYTNMFVAKMSDERVLVSTDNMLFVDTEELGLDASIDMLQELAGLDSITRSVPITIRLVFDLVEQAS